MSRRIRAKMFVNAKYLAKDTHSIAITCLLPHKRVQGQWLAPNTTYKLRRSEDSNVKPYVHKLNALPLHNLHFVQYLFCSLFYLKDQTKLSYSVALIYLQFFSCFIPQKQFNRQIKDYDGDILPSYRNPIWLVFFM